VAPGWPYEEGHGEPLLLVHGRPLSFFIWRKVIALASPSSRRLAPALLGLGDTVAGSAQRRRRIVELERAAWDDRTGARGAA
jgi:pimeloyl-ACP methyl ester carboxylesterase